MNAAAAARRRPFAGRIAVRRNEIRGRLYLRRHWPSLSLSLPRACCPPVLRSVVLAPLLVAPRARRSRDEFYSARYRRLPLYRGLLFPSLQLVPPSSFAVVLFDFTRRFLLC